MNTGIQNSCSYVGAQASPRRHSSVDELYGLVNSSQSLTAVNGQRQRSLSDSGPRDESAQSNGKNVRRVVSLALKKNRYLYKIIKLE